MAMVEELVQVVARQASLAPADATLAVGAMLRFLAARLPSPLFGELQSRLHDSGTAPTATTGPTAPTAPTQP